MRIDKKDPSLSVPEAGLCGDCRHRRVHRGTRSLFFRCARAGVDPSFPRFPRLPVLVCAGYEADEADETADSN